MQIKKIILINFVVLFILIFLIELTLRVIFSYNVQGLSENLINKSLNFNFHNSIFKWKGIWCKNLYRQKWF